MEITAEEQVLMGGVWGRIDSVNAEIKYVRGKLNTETADTVLHEVLHGISRAMYIEFDSKEDEEDVVVRFAAGLITVFKDNPDFLNAIVKLLK